MPQQQKTVSGRCVFYIRPDAETTKEAIVHAMRIGNRPIYTATQPLISLYQAEFDQAPIDEIDKILDAMDFLLRTPLRLSRTALLATDGHDSLRWMTEYDKQNIAAEPLYQAHTTALGLARWLDRVWHGDVLREATSRKTSRPTKDEMSNLIDFGQEDARTLYEPYMLLAIAQTGHGIRTVRQNATRIGSIDQIGFATILKAAGAIKLVNAISVRM
jgi:hypothetical protein